MTSNVQSLIRENIIDDRMPLEPMLASSFDACLEAGWRLLGHGLIRHNFSWCRGKMCNTIPLRVCMANFTLSKSQRKLLKKNTDLTIVLGPIHIDEGVEDLFFRHNERFAEQKPLSIYSFLHPNAAAEPVCGLEFRIFEQSTHICSSYIHVGDRAVSATYCIFDPAFGHRSLGLYSMLLELLFVQEKGYDYYYHGYINDVPSQFDYKLNFNNLEALDWDEKCWKPRSRQVLRNWAALVEPYLEKETREVAPLSKDSLEWLHVLNSVSP